MVSRTLYKSDTVSSVLVSLFLVIAILCSSFLAACGSSGAVPQDANPSYRSFEAITICLDTTGSVNPSFRVKAAHQIGDRIDSMTQPNTGGMAVFVNQIENFSVQTDLVDFSVPAIAALPQKPVPRSNPYTYAKALSDYKKQLPAALVNLHTIQAQVKQETDKIRALPLSTSAGGTDIFGCFDSAADNFASLPQNAITTIVIVSDMQNNQTLQETKTLHLQGVTVKVYYRQCQVASACQENDRYWRGVLQSDGVTSVTFYSPADSQALGMSF